MSENKNMVQRHGCIVCGKLFDVLAVYTHEDKLLDFTVTSHGGHALRSGTGNAEHQPIVACDTHTADEIEAAYQRWQSRAHESDE